MPIGGGLSIRTTIFLLVALGVLFSFIVFALSNQIDVATEISHSDLTMEKNRAASEAKDESINSEVDSTKISHLGADGATREAHAFYYPWYANDDVDGEFSHWNHRVLPHWEKAVNAKYPRVGEKFDPLQGEIGSVYYPTLGLYSSASRDVVRQHFSWMLGAGIDVIVLSWHGIRGTDGEKYRTDERAPMLFEVAGEMGMRICLHLEPYEDRTIQTVHEDIQYAFKNYGHLPAFYRTKSLIPGDERQLPVFYAYDSYGLKNNEWNSLLNRKTGKLRNTEYDGIFLGLYLDDKSKHHLLQSSFDGFFTYFAATGFTQGSTPSNWGDIMQWASQNSLLFVPSVGPGYDDTRIRPWNSANTKSRRGTEYFEEMWDSAVETLNSARLISKDAEGPKSNPNSGLKILSITSWNEWGEGTQIEPAKSYVSKENHEYPIYAKESENGELYYLDYVRAKTSAFYGNST